MIRSRAAVAWAPGELLDITEIDVAPPRSGEVLLRVVATGVCHTDALCWGMKVERLWRRLARALPQLR